MNADATLGDTKPKSSWARWAAERVANPKTSRGCLLDIVRAADLTKPDECAIAGDARERLGS